MGKKKQINYQNFMKQFDDTRINKKFTREEMNGRKRETKKNSTTFESVAEKFSKEAKKNITLSSLLKDLKEVRRNKYDQHNS